MRMFHKMLTYALYIVAKGSHQVVVVHKVSCFKHDVLQCEVMVHFATSIHVIIGTAGSRLTGRQQYFYNVFFELFF